MTLFVLMVFAIYGGTHAYVFVRARSAFAFGLIPGVIIAAFMLFMVFAIFLIRTLELHEYEAMARGLSYFTYLWMVMLFYVFCGSLLFDLLSLVVRVAGWISRTDISPYLIGNKTSFYISLSAALVISLYGYFEARSIRTERLTIETSKLPADIEKVTIAQISDVHLGLIIRQERFAPMIKAVKEAKPDIFVVTGDLVDAQINHLHGLADMLREVDARFGRFAVMGNHEYYAGPEKSKTFIREAGLTLLRDEAVQAGPITIVGADDRTGEQLHLGKTRSSRETLLREQNGRFILFLKHQPRNDPSTIGLFDLQLSGHTHKGQIYPFIYLVRLNFAWLAGKYDLGSGSILYVNRGTGTWGPPVRFLSPPEVTIIELVRQRPVS